MLSRTALCLLAAALFASCSKERAAPPPGQDSDEARIRKELAVPAEARLLSLSADPKVPGTFGREGLRLLAVFELPGGLAERFQARVSTMPGWAALPLPPAAHQLRDPPKELPAPARGLGYCRIGHWRIGMEFDAHACGAPVRADRYSAAVFDPADRKLYAVFKNYF